VSVLHILKAFEKGAVGVLVMGCQEGACHHLTGNIRAKERVKKASALLKEIGIDGNRVRMVNLAPESHQQFVQEVSKLSQKLKELGPSPVRKGEVKK
jgi:coenzyme F420-reducing hydrogenase delta subunit